MTFLQVLEALSYIVTVLGFPIAIIVYLNEKEKERREREYGTYHALDEKYLYFLELCMKYPNLNIYSIPLEEQEALTPQQEVIQYALFEIEISLFERAFLMFQDTSTELKLSQWQGWHHYIVRQCQRQEFRELWDLLGKDYDLNFMEYINSIIREVKEEAAKEG